MVDQVNVYTCLQLFSQLQLLDCQKKYSILKTCLKAGKKHCNKADFVSNDRFDSEFIPVHYSLLTGEFDFKGMPQI